MHLVLYANLSFPKAGLNLKKAAQTIAMVSDSYG
jgi:hypothetical protein